MQCHSVGMYRSRGAIAAALKAVFGDKLDAVYDKSSQTVPYKANLGAIDGYLYGSHAGAEVVLENDLKFSVDWQSGQKTRVSSSTSGSIGNWCAVIRQGAECSIRSVIRAAFLFMLLQEVLRRLCLWTVRSVP